MKTPTLTDEQVELATRLRIAFVLVARAQRQHVPEALTAVQLSALYKVEFYGPLRLGDLAAREQVAGPTMTRVVAALEAKKMVTRETDPTSARCSLVTITAAGSRQIDALRRDRTDFMCCRLAKLPPEHQQALAAALPAIEALVDSVLPRNEIAQQEITEREMERTRRARQGGGRRRPKKG